MDHSCTYCGAEGEGSNHMTGQRVTGQMARACKGICSTLLNAELRMWVGLQYSTMCVSSVRAHTLNRYFSQFTPGQLRRLANHEGPMHLGAHTFFGEGDGIKKFKERAWSPCVIAFGVEKLERLCRDGGVGEMIGYDDVMEEAGFDPKTVFDGHDAGYAIALSTPEEIRKVAHRVLKESRTI